MKRLIPLLLSFVMLFSLTSCCFSQDFLYSIFPATNPEKPEPSSSEPDVSSEITSNAPTSIAPIESIAEPSSQPESSEAPISSSEPESSSVPESSKASETTNIVAIPSFELDVDIDDDVPSKVISYAKKYVNGEVDKLNDKGIIIKDGKITAIKQIETGTAALTYSIDLYRIEYRLLPVDPNVKLSGGRKMKDGWITEQKSSGKPYLLMYCDDSSSKKVWKKICMTTTDEINNKYGTSDMIDKYGNKFTAAAMELYNKHKSEL